MARVWVLVDGFNVYQSHRNDSCTKCNRWFESTEEKQTDVNIGLYLYRDAHLDRYDRAILVTDDTDLVPAIRMVKDMFPRKRIGVMFPIDRHAEELKRACDFVLYTKPQHLSPSQFPDQLRLSPSLVFCRPDHWK